jgi:hypothetical protein
MVDASCTTATIPTSTPHRKEWADETQPGSKNYGVPQKRSRVRGQHSLRRFYGHDSDLATHLDRGRGSSRRRKTGKGDHLGGRLGGRLRRDGIAPEIRNARLPFPGAGRDDHWRVPITQDYSVCAPAVRASITKRKGACLPLQGALILFQAMFGGFISGQDNRESVRCQVLFRTNAKSTSHQF